MAAFGANLLQIKPCIVVQDGKMSVGKKYRGNLDKSVADYIRGRLEGRTDIGKTRIFVTHSSMAAESVAKAKELVHQLQPEAEVLESSAGCTICSHCGPNCLGVLFIPKA